MSLQKKCPRCKSIYPSHFFEEPVSICLPCYARIPENVSIGFDVERLRRKARASKFAKRSRKEKNSMAFAKLMFPSYYNKQAIGAHIGKPETGSVEDEDTCEACLRVPLNGERAFFIYLKNGMSFVACNECAEKEILPLRPEDRGGHTRD